jgi:hypothetical protein
MVYVATTGCEKTYRNERLRDMIFPLFLLFMGGVYGEDLHGGDGFYLRRCSWYRYLGH